MPGPRPTIRRLSLWIAAIALALAVLRLPFRVIREQQHFHAHAREGTALVQSYRIHCPPDIAPAGWSQAVDFVQTAWGNIVFSPHHIDDADLDAILAELRRMSARATPPGALGDLYHILDLLDHARTLAGTRYLANMREMFRASIAGTGPPGPWLALDALDRLGPQPPGRPTLDSLLGGLQAPDWSARVACTRALGQYALGLGTKAEAQSAIDGLIRALADGDRLVREIAAESLFRIGPAAARAGPALAECWARDPDDRVRWQAIRATAAVEPDRSAAISALTAAVDDINPVVREAAIEALGEMGPAARAALPAIHSALAHSDSRTRGAAMTAIAKIVAPSETAVPALLIALEADGSLDVRLQAIDSLASRGAEASAAVPVLIARLASDHAPAVRSAAADALARIAPADPRTAAALARTMKDDASEDTRRIAAEQLSRIRPTTTGAGASRPETHDDP